MKNKLIIAAAGSGKTSFIVDDALDYSANHPDKELLITTYTEANYNEIRKRIIESTGYIPSNITVQTWFKFLIDEGVKPFQSEMINKKIVGMILVNSASAPRSRETDIERHYFSGEMKIYSDKIAKFAFKCNEATDGDVINRVERIYSRIYIDEAQDLAGYDLEIIRLLMTDSSRVILVCDPRQGTYSTNSLSKNKKYRRSKLELYFDKFPDLVEIDADTLNINYRCHPSICELSNELYPEMVRPESNDEITADHVGIHVVRPDDVKEYLTKYSAVQLRWNVSSKQVVSGHPVINFGAAKGLSFDHVLIIPTEKIVEWLCDNSKKLEEITLAKFYVALTRARYSVGIVVKNGVNLPDFNEFKP